MDQAVSLQGRRIDLASTLPFALGAARVDPAAHEITIAGHARRMQPKTLKVLVALHDRIGELVTRDELVDRCWDGRVLGEDVINRCISLLRRFAAESGGFRIETVPRRGYRLVETVRARSVSKRWWPAIAAGAALLIAAGAASLNRTRASDEASPLTVAVLPLAEDSQGSDVRQFAASLRSSLSDALTRDGYPVALIDERAGYRKPDLLISGHIQRTNSTFQALVQVQDTGHGVTVLSHRFEADEKSVPDLPDQIGAWVAANLSWAATLMMLDRRHPSDPAIAAELLNDGSLEIDGGDKLRAYEVARQVAPNAPNSAIAQFSLAFESADVLDELPRDQRAAAVEAGRRAADRLAALAPDFGDAHAAWCGLHDPALIGECEDHLRASLRIDPAAPIAADALAAVLNAVGRVDESLHLAQVSLAKDPLNPWKLGRMIRLLEATADTADADRLFRQSIRWWPKQKHAIYWSRLVGIEARANYAELERFASEVHDDQLPLDRDAAAKVIAAARAHDSNALSRACERKALRGTTQSLCMTALADLGKLDASFAIARQLFPPAPAGGTAWLDQPPAFSIAVLSSPAAASLRRDPRFLELVDSFGLLNYWRSGRLPDFCKGKAEAVCARIEAPSAAGKGPGGAKIARNPKVPQAPPHTLRESRAPWCFEQMTQQRVSSASSGFTAAQNRCR